MVVDIRYHVASLVAVFFALGLGVLVGVSISGDADGLKRQEEWLSAIDRELATLRTDRKEIAARLDATTRERDQYKELATELSGSLMKGRLGGRSVQLITVGPGDEGDARHLETAFRNAGATLLPTGRVLDTDAGSSDGLAAPSDGGPPGRALAVLYLTGTPDAYGPAVRETVAKLKQAGITDVVAVSRGNAWSQFTSESKLSYVAHVDSPYGLLSAVLLLEAGETGSYGEPDALWPRHLLAT